MNTETPDPPFGATTSNRDLTRRVNREATIALLCEGVRPTVANVRARSRRGSSGQVAEAISETLVEAGRALAGNSWSWQGGIPPAAAAAFQRLWEAVSEEARKSFEDRLQALEDQKFALPSDMLANLTHAATVKLDEQVAGLRTVAQNLQREAGRLQRTTRHASGKRAKPKPRAKRNQARVKRVRKSVKAKSRRK